MLRRVDREKVERIIIVWKQQEKKLEHELELIRSTMSNGDTIVYDATVENQRMIEALQRRLESQTTYMIRCWSDPVRNELRVWMQRRPA